MARPRATVEGPAQDIAPAPATIHAARFVGTPGRDFTIMRNGQTLSFKRDVPFGADNDLHSVIADCDVPVTWRLA